MLVEVGGKLLRMTVSGKNQSSLKTVVDRILILTDEFGAPDLEANDSEMLMDFTF